MRAYKLLVLALALLFSEAANAALPDLADLQIKGRGYSAMPFTGYDDKSGWLFGGAGFVYRDVDPALNVGLFGVTNGNDFHSVTLNYEQRTARRWVYVFHGLAERAFDIYYGEGDLTDVHNPLRMSLAHFEARPGLNYIVRPHLFLGIFLDYRARLETEVERVGTEVAGDPQRLFPDESTNALGLHLAWDDRDSILSSRRGTYFQVDYTVQPQVWTTLKQTTNFSQVKVDYRRFHSILPDLVLATRGLGGYSFGEPGYLFRFRLGGVDTLRGYKDNRFRGRRFLAWQEELRWRMGKWITLNLSSDLGTIGDDEFRQLKVTGQIGLRFGLPPDGKQKMRADWAFGADQQTFQVQFGEIF